MLILGVALAGCGGSSTDPTDVPQPPPSATPEEPAVPTPTPEEDVNTPPSDDLEQLPQPVQLAVEAAAEEAGVAPDNVRVLGYEERDWPSTALGCPQPGFSYAQVVTPGFLVQVSAGDTSYEYHTNLTSNVVLCSRF